MGNDQKKRGREGARDKKEEQSGKSHLHHAHCDAGLGLIILVPEVVGAQGVCAKK